MTFDPGSGSQVLLCVHITLRGRSGTSDAELYWSEGAHTYDWADGSRHEWEGRILDGWTFDVPRQRFRSAQWATPRLDMTIMVGDTDDTIWSYLDTSSYEWDGSEATVYLIADGDSATILDAEVVGGPVEARVNGSLRIQLGHRLARRRLPVRSLREPAEYGTEFVSPSRQGSETLKYAISSTATTIRIDAASLATGTWFEGRVAYIPSTGEAIWIGGVGSDATSAYISDCVRGYAGTTAAAASAAADIEVYHNGLHWGYADGAARSTVVGYVFGRGGSAHRGVVVPLRIHSHAGNASDTSDPMEAYISRGLIYSIHAHYDDIGGSVTSRTGAYQVTVYDDESSPFTGTATHRTPHFLLCGSYTVTPSLDTYGSLPDGIWVRVSGIEDGAGDPIRYAEGIAKYLLEDDQSLGETGAVYTGRITGYDSGVWHDELATAGFGDDVQGICPAPGSGDRPLIMEALQDLAHLCVSEWTLRGGQLYPYWLGVLSSASSADVSITSADLREGHPSIVLDPDRDRCNMFVLDPAQDVLCDANAAQNYDPFAIPMQATARDDDALSDDDGEPRYLDMSIQWFWHRPDSAWAYRDSTTNLASRPNRTMSAAADDWLGIMAQPQTYVRATIGQEFLADVLGGLSVQYDHEPLPSSLGLIRSYQIRRSGGALLIDLESLHLDTWPS